MRYQFIYQKWWKVMCLLFLLYVFIAGFLVPLKQGIIGVSDFQLSVGAPYDIDVSTYNAHLDQTGGRLAAYIKVDSAHLTRVPYVTVTGRNEVNLKGTLPGGLPYGDERLDATLILSDQSQDYMFLTSAFSIMNQTDINPNNASGLTWNEELLARNVDWKFQFPFVPILYETVRNTFFHVAIWMAMFVLLMVSLIYSIKYLRGQDMLHDAVAASFTHVAVFLGSLGMITGSIWAKTTWGTYWTDDPKLNMSAVAMMIYLAYSILRASMPDGERRAKVSASFNIFAFVAMIPLIFIIPRLSELDSMHPGNGGNPAFGGDDMDNTLRMVFYPAILGYTLMGVWLSSILFRIRKIKLARLHRALKG